MALIEQRHPAFERQMVLWRSCRVGEALPRVSALGPDQLADLAPVTVLLARRSDGPEVFTIVASGAEVDALYGAPLIGAPAGRLAPVRGDAEQEALSAVETTRPVLIEDDLRAAGRRRRVARL